MLYNIRFDTYQFNLKCYFYTRKEKQVTRLVQNNKLLYRENK